MNDTQPDPIVTLVTEARLAATELRAAVALIKAEPAPQTPTSAFMLQHMTDQADRLEAAAGIALMDNRLDNR